MKYELIILLEFYLTENIFVMFRFEKNSLLKRFKIFFILLFNQYFQSKIRFEFLDSILDRIEEFL